MGQRVSAALVFSGCVISGLGCGGEAHHLPSSFGGMEVHSTGAISLQIADGLGLDSMSYDISGPSNFAQSGTIDLFSQSTLSGTIGGLPPGFGFTINLSGVLADGNTTCFGTAPFDVQERMTTSVSIRVLCHQRPNGSISIRGSVNICPVIDLISAMPDPSAYVGQTVSLSSTVRDADSGPFPLTYRWTIQPGSLDDPASAAPTFVCSAAGDTQISLTASDGDPSPDCAASYSISVSCIDPGCLSFGGGSSQFKLGLERRIDPTDSADEAPVLAHDGDQYLALWHSTSLDAYESRPMDATGAATGPVQLVVARPAGQSDTISLAGGAGSFMATWFNFLGDLSVMTVDSEGVPIVAKPTVLTSFEGGSRTKAPIAFDGTSFRLVSEHVPPGFPSWDVSVSGFLFDPDGNQLPGTVSVPGGGNVQNQVSFPGIACRSGRCLIAYRDLGGMFGPTPVTTYIAASFDGAAPGFYAPVDGMFRPAVAYGDGVWLVAWQSTDTQFHAVRLSDLSGASSDPLPAGLALGQAPIAAPLTATFVGGEFLLAWGGADGFIHINRLGASGDVLDGAGVIGPKGNHPTLSGELLAYERNGVDYVRHVQADAQGPEACGPEDVCSSDDCQMGLCVCSSTP